MLVHFEQKFLHFAYIASGFIGRLSFETSRHALKPETATVNIPAFNMVPAVFLEDGNVNPAAGAVLPSGEPACRAPRNTHLHLHGQKLSKLCQTCAWVGSGP